MDELTRSFTHSLPLIKSIENSYEYECSHTGIEYGADSLYLVFEYSVLEYSYGVFEYQFCDSFWGETGGEAGQPVSRTGFLQPVQLSTAQSAVVFIYYSYLVSISKGSFSGGCPRLPKMAHFWQKFSDVRVKFYIVGILTFFLYFWQNA